MTRQFSSADVLKPPTSATSTGPVPQEHDPLPADHPAPRDWSQMGRRVLAEAWRRFMDERARRTDSATPVAPAPHAEEEQT